MREVDADFDLFDFTDAVKELRPRTGGWNETILLNRDGPVLGSSLFSLSELSTINLKTEISGLIQQLP